MTIKYYLTMTNNNSNFQILKVENMNDCTEEMRQDKENWFDSEIEAWTVGFDKISF